MDITTQPVLIAGSPDEEGRLVFAGGRLVAVLVRLSEVHQDQAGWWFLEVGFGVLAGPRHPSFPDLPGALRWIEAQTTAATAMF